MSEQETNGPVPLPKSRLSGYLTSVGGYGWRHVFLHTIRRYPLQLLSLFVTGVSAMALELVGFGLVILSVSALEREPGTQPSGLEKYVQFEGGSLVLVVVLFVSAMAASAILHFLNGWLTAYYRRKTFEDVMADTVETLRDRPDDAFVYESGIRGLSRVLRRDCRYLSRSITDAMKLPVPFLILVSTVIAGLMFFPYFSLVVLGLLALMLPFHILVGFWGGKVTDQLLKSASAKSAADQSVIDAVFLSPYAGTQEDEHAGSLGRAHSESEKVQPFLRAYEKRIRTIPASLLISRITFLVVLLILGVLGAKAYQAGSISLSEILTFLVGLRLAMTSMSELAAGVTNIISFSPLISGLADFLNSSRKHHEGLPTLTLVSEPPNQNSGLFLISDAPFSWEVASSITARISGPGRDVQIITGDYGNLPPHMKLAHIKRRLGPAWNALSNSLRDKIRKVCFDKSSTDEVGKSASALIDLCSPDQEVDLYWSSSTFSALSAEDRAQLLAWLSTTRLIVVYPKVPKRVPRLKNFGVWTLQSQKIQLHCAAEDFDKNRDTILKFVETSAPIGNIVDDVEDIA